MQNSVTYSNIRIASLAVPPEAPGNYRKYILTNNGALCWHCCHGFEWEPIGIPLVYPKDRTQPTPSLGYFCSYNCAKTYLVQHASSIKMLKSIPLLAARLRNIRASKGLVATLIRAAPSRELLTGFGGPITIDDFRRGSLMADGTVLGGEEEMGVPRMATRALEIYDFRTYMETECVNINREPRLTENLVCRAGLNTVVAAAPARRKKGRPPKRARGGYTEVDDNVMERRRILEGLDTNNAKASDKRTMQCPGVTRKPRRTLKDSMGIQVNKM